MADSQDYTDGIALEIPENQDNSTSVLQPDSSRRLLGKNSSNFKAQLASEDSLFNTARSKEKDIEVFDKFKVYAPKIELNKLVEHR